VFSVRPDGLAMGWNSMPSCRPSAKTLDLYQLQLCANVFNLTWLEIVPRGYRLLKDQEVRLQDEISNRLCALAAKGINDPDLLQALTVATVGLRQRIRRRSPTRLGTPKPRAG
jgi:hypothetical protein